MTIIDMDKVGEALNNKADIDLNNTGVFSTSEGGVVNLTSSTPANANGKEVTSADFIKSDIQSNLLNYTTNRILEIPQDIKLELNNGTLTLKAGSNVYVPNGPGVFDVVTVPSDVVFHTGTIGSATGTFMLFCNSSGGFGARTGTTVCASGTTNPGSGYYLWYDTTNNKIKFSQNADGNFDSARYSFPVGIYQRENGNAVSIDQIFNGFGYIGSTVFALPGVKVQIPNGRNEDGTCKSNYGTIRSVQQTSVNPGNGNYSIRIGNNFIAVSKFVYDEETNYNYNQTVSPSNIRYQTNAGTVSYLSGRIASLQPFTVDSVVNSNEFYQLRDKAVTTDTAQTISGVKTFTGGTLKANTPLLLKQDNADEGGQIDFQLSNNSVLKNNPLIDLYVNTIRFIGVNSNNTTNTTLQVDLQNNQVLVPTPALTANGTQAATTAWFNQKMQVVSALPAAPDANVFYFIPE